MLDLQLAGLAGACVAHLGTGVLGTVEDGTAHAGTLQQRGLATSHWLATDRKRKHGFPSRSSVNPPKLWVPENQIKLKNRDKT